MKAKTKRVPMLAAVAVTALTMSACGGGDETASGDSGSGGSRAITFVQGVAGDEFYITMQCGIEEEAKKQDVTVNTQGPAKFDPSLQRPIIDSVVADKPDALLVAPTDVSAMQGPLQAAAPEGRVISACSPCSVEG